MTHYYIFRKLDLHFITGFILWSFFLLQIEGCTYDDLIREHPVNHAHPDDSKRSFVAGNTIPYTCDAGFKIAGGANLAFCEESEGTLRWVPSTLVCVEEECGELPDVFFAEKGVVEGKVAPYPVGSRAKYSCGHGHRNAGGTDTATCIRDADNKVSWTLPTMKCDPVNCGDPGYARNAERDGHLFTYGNHVTYKCHKGYTTSDKVELYCLPRGQWSDEPPVCGVIHCPNPERPADGDVRYSDLSYLSEAVYSCSEGFHLQGDSRSSCTSNGTWSNPTPTCGELRCKPFTELPGIHIVHGARTDEVGDLVIMKCVDGSNQITLKCTNTGEWSRQPPNCPVLTTTTTVRPTPRPTFVPTTSTKITTTATTSTRSPSESGKCDDPGNLPHGSIAMGEKEISFPTNSSLTFVCDPGYTLKGEATLRCLRSGEWEPSKMPACMAPTPISTIIGVAVGIILLLALIIVAIIFFIRKRKAREEQGKIRKAHSIDARDSEEMRCLEKEKKPIPVTSL